ncbi:DUF3379 family protein [Psychromonas arctica]|uniref:DUF3379 family protein n=1 Tax=Psychromonas arctica TaxID=168275 RepID=UPI00041FDD99|nr:DUF3379 family protein [Psychromonas arctica]
MDDILFRHTAIATPNDKSDAFLSRAAASDCAKNLVEESKAFDKLLKDSLQIEVPSDLTDKILLEQSFALEHDKTVSARWHIGIAASIAFIIGISVPMVGEQLTNSTTPINSAQLVHTPSDIGSVALQHVKQEYFLTAKANENATLQSVNAKLAIYGAKATDSFGEVLFVNYCSFEGTSALHMILKGEKGRITVFVVPEDAGFKPSSSFKDQHLKGISEHIGKASLVIVGEQDEPLEMMKEKLAGSIKWDI